MAFIAMIRHELPGDLLETTIEWINESMEPNEVFDNNKLESWAEDNGYIKKED